MRSLAISPFYIPRTLGIYLDQSRLTQYRLVYPFQHLANQGYAVGWAQDVTRANLDVYDLVSFLRTPWTDDDLLAEQIRYAKHHSKVVVVDNANFGDVPEKTHGVIVPSSFYNTGTGTCNAVVDTGVDFRSWPDTPRWTPGKVIGLVSDLPGHVLVPSWRKLLPGLAQIRQDFPDIQIAVGYGDDVASLFAQVATSKWENIVTNEHPWLANSCDIVLCFADLPQPHDVYEAGLHSATVIGNALHAPYIRSRGTVCEPEQIATAIASLLNHPERQRVQSLTHRRYVEDHKTTSHVLKALVHAWQEIYSKTIGTPKIALIA